MTTRRTIAITSMFLAGCAGQVDVGHATQEGGDESDSQETTVYEAESAIVGQPARVTASALNLRTGPSTSYSVILVMPSGAVVDVTAASNGWYKVSYSNHTGWCSGTYLTPISQNPPNGSAIDQAMSRAASGVGFSYKWGGSAWDPASSAHGSCVGSCPDCTHHGSWGADCSGYAAKVWQVPGKVALTTVSHPYNTASFRYRTDHWTQIPRSAARRGDAMVHNENGSGHIFIVDGGDPWGHITAYEAKGCSYGIVKNSRTASSNYIAIRREGF